MLIDGTKTEIKSIHSSGEVDALEKIRLLEMIEMLRIGEECQIVDGKEIDECLSLRRSSRNIKKSNYNDPNDSLDCLKTLNQNSGFTDPKLTHSTNVHSTSFEVGNVCEMFSVKFEPDVDVEMLSDTISSKNIKIENKIDKIGTTQKAKKQNKGKSEPKTLAQLRKSNSLISKSFENSHEPKEYQGSRD